MRAYDEYQYWTLERRTNISQIKEYGQLNCLPGR